MLPELQKKLDKMDEENRLLNEKLNMKIKEEHDRIERVEQAKRDEAREKQNCDNRQIRGAI